MSENKSQMIQVKQVEAFLKLDSSLIERGEISSVDTTRLEDELLITVITKTGHSYVATNINAIEFIMQTRPGLLEGKKLKWAKNMWIIHNLFAHPLMQIFSWFKAYHLAMWIHDVTVPKPQGKKTVLVKKDPEIGKEKLVKRESTQREPIEPVFNEFD